MSHGYVEQYNRKGIDVTIEQDMDAMDPRDKKWQDNAGTIVSFTHDWSPDEVRADKDEFMEGWKDEPSGSVLIPVRYEDHGSSGSKIRWDVDEEDCNGAIICRRYTVIKEWGRNDRLTSWSRRKCIRYLKCEIEELEQYYNGDVYGYFVTDGSGDDDKIDSCWGYYGLECCKEEANRIADEMAENPLVRAIKEARRKKRVA